MVAVRTSFSSSLSGIVCALSAVTLAFVELILDVTAEAAAEPLVFVDDDGTFNKTGLAFV